MSIYNRLSRTTAAPGLLRWLRRGYLLARGLLARVGFQLVYASYDSPIPDVRSLEPEFFDRPDPMRGVAFDVDRQMEFVERELADHCRKFDPPMSAAEAAPHRFYLRNGTYESVDAELLYAMVRRFAPRRVVELGSGYSTLIIREALERHGVADIDRTLHTYDPYPSSLLAADWPVAPLPVQDISDEVFDELEAGDLLFVDTSHTVKAGGDVNRIVLDVLPMLRPGVIVHFHDIFLPYPYSRKHLEEAHFWTEQYLLQAFLTANDGWEVLVGGYAVARAHPSRLGAVIPSFSPGASPGAFWIRRRG
jgi:predicted O-methyltransferase YrrM